MPDKPYLHFTTNRSGSVPIGMLLEAYFEQNFGLLGLGDFFESRPEYLLERDAPRAKLPRGHLPKSERGRVDLLMRKKEKYFFTCYPGHSPHTYKFLLKNYRFIFSERRNLADQMLSFLISMSRNSWYKKPGEAQGRRATAVRKEHFSVFLRHMTGYYQIKSYLKPKRVLLYENFVEMGPQELLRSYGLRRPVDLSGVQLPAQQNANKAAQILNLSDAREWYRSSFLETISPWPKQFA